MDSEELLALMISTPAPAPNLGDWDSVLLIYARHLERLAPKLDERDLGALIASGAMFYRTLRQAEAARVEALERWAGPRPRNRDAG
ncbi:DNA-3-methyladenine glycosylase [Achromobacter xylosoxidans]|uniref:DNA-3-methyladenine glycosylase n=1 Tax=Alcaligenes xylosoxydans xylosoxydans TaxID=85698 RepID=UPI0006BEC7D7|nr:DNA-3-methyladenine glycosylase [Achromobacter xylosoxidans]CUJ21426.1 Uncharacterised protein [Achromobacter xylosoxidans]